MKPPSKAKLLKDFKQVLDHIEAANTNAGADWFLARALMSGHAKSDPEIEAWLQEPIAEQFRWHG